MTASIEFDLIVIGGGGSGYAAASTAAKLGRRVAMVEGGKLGGTCLNVGCVPTKVLVRSAQILESVRRAGEFGISVPAPRLDFAAVMERKRAVIEGFSGEGPKASLRKQNIELLQGQASFVDPHTLCIGGTSYRADRFVIATGSTTVIPDLPGLAETEYHTSDTLLDLHTLPESLLIVGGGIIGCEFASIFNAFGTHVTVVGQRLLGAEDEDVSEELHEAFTRRGIEVLKGSRATGFRQEGIQKTASILYDNGRTEERSAQVLLLAVGRRPNHDGLDLEIAGIRTLPNGGIKVGLDMSTSVSHIWAAGDVTGMHMYTHAGDAMGEIAGWNAVGGSPRRETRFSVVPRPVYSLPEVASIGLTEREAGCIDCDLEVSKVYFREISRSIINGDTEGWCKIIADRMSGHILGASIVGAEANELIAEIATAMAGGVSAWTLGDTLHPYPTVSEIVRWTADQIGKNRDSAGEPDMRHALYTESLSQIKVRHSTSARDEPVTPEKMMQVAEPRGGYGQVTESIEDGTVV